MPPRDPEGSAGCQAGYLGCLLGLHEYIVWPAMLLVSGSKALEDLFSEYLQCGGNWLQSKIYIKSKNCASSMMRGRETYIRLGSNQFDIQSVDMFDHSLSVSLCLFLMCSVQVLRPGQKGGQKHG